MGGMYCNHSLKSVQHKNSLSRFVDFFFRQQNMASQGGYDPLAWATPTTDRAPPHPKPTTSRQQAVTIPHPEEGTGGTVARPSEEEELPLLEELGIDLQHIKSKSVTVLHPFRAVDQSTNKGSQRPASEKGL